MFRREGISNASKTGNIGNSCVKVCPICGKVSDNYCVSAENLKFLVSLAYEKKINAAVSMARILWENVPQLRLPADSIEIVDELSRT
jgi:hypothetical protein